MAAFHFLPLETLVHGMDLHHPSHEMFLGTYVSLNWCTMAVCSPNLSVILGGCHDFLLNLAEIG